MVGCMIISGGMFGLWFVHGSDQLLAHRHGACSCC